VGGVLFLPARRLSGVLVAACDPDRRGPRYERRQHRPDRFNLGGVAGRLPAAGC
jgi:hypothetical protein